MFSCVKPTLEDYKKARDQMIKPLS
ncbi:MAG: hypothetical protein GXW90_06720 [Tepidanaerobacter acetatoxydans]|nr:hypothetical protein [Tepidanaerobacter acetatoxydans]